MSQSSSIKVGVEKVFILDFKKYIKFPKETAFHTDIYVLPEYRRLGIASYLLSGVMKFLKDNGFKKIMCHIPRWNINSIKVHTRLGFKKIIYIRLLRIFGFKILTFNPAKIIFKRPENLFVRVLLFVKTIVLIEFIRRVLRRIFCGIFELRTGFLLYKYLDNYIPDIQSKTQISIKRMELADLAQVKNVVSENELRRFKNRLENGKMGFMAYIKNQIVHYSWISFNGEYESWSGLRISPDKETGYLFNAYTIPECRGNGIYPFVLSVQLKYLKEKGYRKAIILIGSRNDSSLKAANKLGFRKEKVFKRIKMFGLKLPLSFKNNQELLNLWCCL